MLEGDFLGCALKDEVSVPHLVNWRTGEMHSLGEIPDINVSCLPLFVYIMISTR